ncbi:hypothetical protein ABZ595_19390 [Streptomyces rubradiris]|uniref:hypothetical protein n=1 Tax=Streptomyces rubradiris TaxID=285531 RepID=UPI0034009DB6
MRRRLPPRRPGAREGPGKAPAGVPAWPGRPPHSGWHGKAIDLSAHPDGTPHHPGRVDQVCRREDLADLVAADSPLGPERATARSRGAGSSPITWSGSDGSAPPHSIEVRFGNSRAGAVDVALYTTASVDAVVPAHPEVDREQSRAVEKSRRSPLASLHPEPAAASA